MKLLNEYCCLLSSGPSSVNRLTPCRQVPAHQWVPPKVGDYALHWLCITVGRVSDTRGVGVGGNSGDGGGW